MHKKIIASLSMILITTLPAFAENSGGSPSTPATVSSPKHGSFHLSEIPLRTLGFLVGTVGGIPVCLVKRLANDEVEGTQALVGETKSLFLLVPAGICWLPFAGLASACEAPVYSMQNSFVAKPFSKEQFSLGENE